MCSNSNKVYCSLKILHYIVIGIDYNKLVPVQRGEERRKVKGKKGIARICPGNCTWVLKGAREVVSIKQYIKQLKLKSYRMILTEIKISK
jgi:hypothetical protein